VAQFFKKLFFPKAWLLALASAAGAAALFGVFYYGQSEQLLIAVPVYAFCTWVLCCVCVRAPRIYRATVRFLKKNRFLRRMMEDREYAATVGILFSFEMDLFYCIFKAVMCSKRILFPLKAYICMILTFAQTYTSNASFVSAALFLV